MQINVVSNLKCNTIYISLVFIYYTNRTNVLLIVGLDLTAKLALISSDCEFGTPKQDDFGWNKVAISVLTRFQ
jgi:hypothetical protein